MPIYDLFGDTSGLPKTRRSSIPFEMEALSPRESWGAGNNNSTYICRQRFNQTAAWIKDMVGEVRIVAQTGTLLLKRFIPEPLYYGEFGADRRVQFCSIADQTEQGGPAGDVEGALFRNAFNPWPATSWQKFRTVFEAFPYAILDEVPVLYLPAMGDVAAGAGAFAGARELYRYMLRTRKTFTKEMTVPGANVGAGVGFHVIDAARKPVPGGFAFRVLSYANVTYKWVRVPIGWPPPGGYLPAAGAPAWPPIFNPAAVDPTTKKHTRDSFQGTINSTWFDCAASDGYCWAPGELLYNGYDDSNKYFDAAGQWVCDVVFTFTAKEGGWNKYLNASGRFVEVSADVVPGDNLHGTIAGRRPYQENDFNNLFQWSA